MPQQISQDIARRFGPTGFYIGLRIRFAFASAEINELPKSWLDVYGRKKFFFVDPALRWSYDHTGAIRWSDLAEDDPAQMIREARLHSMWYGAVVSFTEESGLRSYGVFYRDDREYEDEELDLLAGYVRDLHQEMAPPQSLTRAEIAVLKMIKQGGKLKEIAWELGVTESAIKQRLKNARDKLGATNGTHAATLASQFGLI